MSRDGLNLGLECAKAPFVNYGGKTSWQSLAT